MAIQPRPKELHYKHAEFLGEKPHKTLQELLSDALIAMPNAENRAQQIDNGGDMIRVWNRHAARMLMNCGMFHSYEKGRIQLLLAMKPSVAEYEIIATSAP